MIRKRNDSEVIRHFFDAVGEEKARRIRRLALEIEIKDKEKWRSLRGFVRTSILIPCKKLVTTRMTEIPCRDFGPSSLGDFLENK